MRRVGILGVVAAIGLGCGGDGGSSLESKYNRVTSELQKQFDILCDCDEASVEAEGLDCDEDLEFGASDRRCVLDAIEDDEHAGRYLDCMVKSERDYTACIRRDECADKDECDVDYDDDATECEDHLESDAVDDVDRCLGSDDEDFASSELGEARRLRRVHPR